MIRVADLISTFAHDQMTLNRIIRWVEVVLVILLAVSLARLVVDLIPPVAVSNMPVNSGLPVPVEGQGQQTGQLQPDTDRISPALKQLFGKANVSAVTEEELQQPLQQTSLNLTLKGILADRDSDNGLALIAAGDNKEKVYRVADEIEGAEIVRIEPRRVVIRRNGMTEALDLEVRKLSGSMTSTKSNPTANPPDRISFNTGIRKLGDNQWSISRAALKQQLNNLPSLLQQATAVPHTQDGQQIGFRIIDLKPGGVFQQLGIEQNDIIHSVNGSSVRNVEEALNAYRNLGSASAFQVGVVREGKQINLSLSVE